MPLWELLKDQGPFWVGGPWVSDLEMLYFWVWGFPGGGIKSGGNENPRVVLSTSFDRRGGKETRRNG